jgi:hypothetical protein
VGQHPRAPSIFSLVVHLVILLWDFLSDLLVIPLWVCFFVAFCGFPVGFFLAFLGTVFFCAGSFVVLLGYLS